MGETRLWIIFGILSHGSLLHPMTSLTIKMSLISVLQIWEVLRLPGLNNLELVGSLSRVDLDTLWSIGKLLRGKFGGTLILSPHIMGIVDITFRVSTASHSIEVHTPSTKHCLLPIMRLLEACGESLTVLSCRVDDHEGKGRFVRTLDFEKFPNLEDAKITGHFTTASSLRWLYMSLSTIKPTNLPRLSILRLGRLPLCPTPDDPQEKLHKNLRLIKNEVDRIERDFNGAVKLTLNEFPGLER